MNRDTGIILNNEQDDFSSPGSVNAFGYSPSPENFVAPGKRQSSSITPTISENKKGELEMVVGIRRISNNNCNFKCKIICTVM
jgi:gamma-glutamyltranspeptidase